MSANIEFNPLLTTTGAGSFATTFDGLIQGTAFDDPATRFRMRGGFLASDETIPMWGGVGIYEFIPGVAGNPNVALGGQVGRATLLTGSKALGGFSVFDQAYAMINTPQSPVPLVGSLGSVNYYPLGSLARIAVAADPALVSLEGGLTTQQVSWDFNLQRLIPYTPAHNALAISAITWTANVASVTVASNSLVTGDDVTISGSDVAAYNGDWTITVVDGTHFTFALPLASDPGDATTGQVDAGGGALNVKVLKIVSDNCMTVDYDTATGFATWNRSGACAVIQI